MPFPVLGRALDVRLDSPALAGWIERAWRYDEHAPDSHPYAIQVEDADGVSSDDLASDPAWTPVEATLPDGAPLRGWRSEDEWRFPVEGGVVAARVDGGGARIRLWSTPRSAALPDSRSARPARLAALYLCITEAVRASGLIPLHAAVVVRGEEATALSAPSGTGKTTTLLRLLADGWHPLAEDLAWLDPATLRLYGWDRGVRLWPDGVARLPAAWREAAWRTDTDGKSFLPWSEIRPARRPTARLRRIVRIERGVAAPAGFEALAPHEAVRVLWEATGVPLIDAARDRTTAAVPELLRRVEFARLRLDAFDGTRETAFEELPWRQRGDDHHPAD